jgi:hypothetical protein
MSNWNAQTDLNAVKDTVVQGTKKVRGAILRALSLFASPADSFGFAFQLASMATDFFNSMESWS